jgi:hypothetical protein
MTTNEEKPESNKWMILLIILTLAVNATIGVGTLAYCLITQTEPNAALLTAFVAIVNFVLGAISGMLVKTSPTETTKQPLPNPPSPIPNGAPTPVEVVNEPTNPVPTEEAPK